MNKQKAYFFGEKALSGYARQKINQDGELSYKGVMHVFGAKIPIYISLEPHDKYVNGEKVYKIFTYLTPMPAERKGSTLQTTIYAANRKRIEAIKKVKETVIKLGEVYECQRVKAEEVKRKECAACRESINSEWEEKFKEQEQNFKDIKKSIEQKWGERLQKAVRSHVKRQREICDRKIQRLLASRKRNKPNNH